MIFRDKLVGNSSSSSFVVHKLDIGETKFNDLIVFLESNFPRNDSWDNWGTSGRTYFCEKNFIVIETYNAPNVVHEAIYKYIPEFDQVSICLDN